MIDKVIEQYKSHDNLDIRVELHKKYSKNKLGFNNWDLIIGYFLTTK
ncbi:transcriptional regulatory protein [Streptococcus pneumoniae]|nr:transcriptional regulatory protein [Streptococcus pneumoniae]VJV11678.1 transcriptional regulatory protein [Streptococcus pneumoniae]VKD10144.1 transcriptional regulatory protein [Streptococcus pneumoniae]VKF93432.1 transcriptional regulatory protein [Streptococcus pneumoniae]VKL82250.1 transcriptional regulatory protein [Streptococcus pneumoniae]